MQHIYKSLKGDFFLREKGVGNYYFIGNVAEAQFSMTRETLELVSSGNESGTLASEETSKAATLSLTLNSLAQKNMATVLYGAVVSQAAAIGKTFELPALAAGEAYPLADKNVSNVVITGLTAGVDYKVLGAGGVIVALVAIAAPAEGTYDCGTATGVGVFTHSGKEYEVLYVSEASGKSAEFMRWKPNPAQALALISNEFASFAIEGPVLIDETLAEGPLGRFARVYDVV
jgi:hypothetical protein